MRVAIMQPYFLPYLGYFALIKHVQKFILLDEVQFIRHGWIERNRIINPKGDFTYLQVPLNKSDGRNTIIRQLSIRNDEPWKRKILSQVEVYKKRAPNYYVVYDLIKKILDFQGDSMVELNRHSLKCIMDYLGISTDIKVFSELDLKIDEPQSAGEWALNICKRLEGVSEYCNPIGGAEIFNPILYQNANIDLVFFAINDYKYDQSGLTFQPHLSIIDVLMFCNKDSVLEMLDNYTLSKLK